MLSKKLFFKLVALVLIQSFLALDIAWSSSGQPLVSKQQDCLAAKLQISTQALKSIIGKVGDDKSVALGTGSSHGDNESNSSVMEGIRRAAEILLEILSAIKLLKILKNRPTVLSKQEEAEKINDVVSKLHSIVKHTYIPEWLSRKINDALCYYVDSPPAVNIPTGKREVDGLLRKQSGEDDKKPENGSKKTRDVQVDQEGQSKVGIINKGLFIGAGIVALVVILGVFMKVPPIVILLTQYLIVALAILITMQFTKIAKNQILHYRVNKLLRHGNAEKLFRLAVNAPLATKQLISKLDGSTATESQQETIASVLSRIAQEKNLGENFAALEAVRVRNAIASALAAYLWRESGIDELESEDPLAEVLKSISEAKAPEKLAPIGVIFKAMMALGDLKYLSETTEESASGSDRDQLFQSAKNDLEVAEELLSELKTSTTSADRELSAAAVLSEIMREKNLVNYETEEGEEILNAIADSLAEYIFRKSGIKEVSSQNPFDDVLKSVQGQQRGQMIGVESILKALMALGHLKNVAEVVDSEGAHSMRPQESARAYEQRRIGESILDVSYILAGVTFLVASIIFIKDHFRWELFCENIINLVKAISIYSTELILVSFGMGLALYEWFNLYKEHKIVKKCLGEKDISTLKNYVLLDLSHRVKKLISGLKHNPSSVSAEERGKQEFIVEVLYAVAREAVPDKTKEEIYAASKTYYKDFGEGSTKSSIAGQHASQLEMGQKKELPPITQDSQLNIAAINSAI